MAVVDLRPPGTSVAAWPGQIRGLTTTGFPTGYLTGKTHEWRLVRAGRTEVYDTFAAVIDGDTLVSGLEVPRLTGDWYVTLYETTGALEEPRAGFTLDVDRTYSSEQTDITVALTVDTGDIEIALDVTLSEGASGGLVNEVVAGPGVSVDATDPTAPVVTAEVTQAELDAEATARGNADTALDGRVDAIEALGATAGFTTADETKLDGIEDGAEVNDTAAEILTKIKTVDGPGSGLDADLLDGQSSAAFATAAQGTAADAAKVKTDFLTVTQPVDLDTIETRVNQLDAAVVLKGVWDASTGSFPGAGAAQAGDSYIVSVGGTVDGVAFVANDRLLAIIDNASAATYAANWLKLDYTDAVLSVDGATGAVVLSGTYVALTGDQTVAGVKTFSSAPVVPDSSFAIGKTNGLQAALDAKAPLASPALTGTPTAPTAAVGTDSTQLATTAHVLASHLVVVPADKTADYTLVLGDRGSSIGVDSATAKNVTVPLNSSVAYPVGTLIEVRQVGAGQVTIVATGGVTLRSAGGALKVRAQYGAVSLLKVASDTWSVQGDITT